MKSKKDTVPVQIKIQRPLFNKVKKLKKKDHLIWKDLIHSLLRAYVKNGI